MPNGPWLVPPDRSRMRLAVVLGQHVVAEVAAGTPQHGVRVVPVAGGVVLDEQVIALYAVVVPGAGPHRPLPGDMQFAAREPGALPRRELDGQPVEEDHDRLPEHRPGAGPELAAGRPERPESLPGPGHHP